jgi:hypothetical protein
VVFRSRLLEAREKITDALAVIEDGLVANPDSIALRIARVALAADPRVSISKEQITSALNAGNSVLLDTNYADADALKAMTRLLFRQGDTKLAVLYLFHSLLLLPDDKELNQLKKPALAGCPAVADPVAAPVP